MACSNIGYGREVISKAQKSVLSIARQKMGTEYNKNHSVLISRACVCWVFAKNLYFCLAVHEETAVYSASRGVGETDFFPYNYAFAFGVEMFSQISTAVGPVRWC